eukprot:7973379-Karenia_brevis.AAC.1
MGKKSSWQQQGQSWTCPACFVQNWPSNKACRHCSARKAYVQAVAPGVSAGSYLPSHSHSLPPRLS